MIAITLSSSASLRTPTTACSGLPAVSKETILSFLPPIAAGGVDLVDRHLRGDLVGLGEGRERTRASEQISKQNFLRLRRLHRRTTDNAVAASNPKSFDFICSLPPGVIRAFNDEIRSGNSACAPRSARVPR